MTKFHRTYQHRAYTSRTGYERIAEVMRESARLYNAALEEWRWAYKTGVSVSLYSQYRELTAIRSEDNFWGSISLQVARGLSGHRSRAKQTRGIASGDLVRLSHRRHGVLEGYAVLDKKRNRVGIQLDGKQVSVKAEVAMLLARNHGYRVAMETNN